MAFLVLEQDDGRYRMSAGVPAYANGPPHRPHLSWNWDGAALTVTSGNLGFFPLYVLQENGRYGVTTSLPELLPFARSTVIDEAAVAAFLHVGFYLGDDTPLQAIRSFPPVDWLKFEAGVVTLGPGFRQPEPTTMSRAQVRKTFAELFAAAIAGSRPSFDTVVPLSGGRDSRHILFELLRLGMRPSFCITSSRYPPLGDDDRRIAAILCERLQLRHRYVAPISDMFAAQITRNERTNFCADEFSWACGLADDLSKGSFSIYDGIAGDVLSAGLFLDRDPRRLYEGGRISELADKLMSVEKEVIRLLSPDAKRRFSYQVAKARLEDELRKFRHLHNPLTQFYFWNRTRREIALFPFGILSRRHEVHTPFLDRALVDFLLSVPTAMTRDKQLHTETILETYPAYSDIPFEDKGLKVKPRYGPTFRSSAKLLFYILSSPFRDEFDLKKLSRSCLGMVRSGVFGGQPAKTLYLNQLLLRIRDARRIRAS